MIKVMDAVLRVLNMLKRSGEIYAFSYAKNICLNLIMLVDQKIKLTSIIEYSEVIKHNFEYLEV